MVAIGTEELDLLVPQLVPVAILALAMQMVPAAFFEISHVRSNAATVMSASVANDTRDL
jgi:hypothetical protein